MNKTINELGEIIISVGADGSHARNKEVFNLTLPKLIQRVRNSQAWSDIKDSSLYQDLENICEDNNIPKTNCRNLIASAFFYSDKYEN